MVKTPQHIDAITHFLH